MKIIGIIAEYNPFHNGHVYQLKKCRELYPDCRIVIAMSGNFTQRAEPAVLDKWQRAKSAVLCGADLVIELPFLYAVSGAESFARGAVRLLSELNCVDVLVFGSEDDFNILEKTADILNKEPENFRSLLKEKLKSGISYAQARSKVLEEDFGISNEILNKPNNILGIEYLKALKRFNSTIVPQNILRIGAGFNDNNIKDDFSSAGALRSELQNSLCSDIFLKNVPSELKEFYKEVDDLTKLDILFRFIVAKLRTVRSERLRNISEINEGIEHRIIKAAQTAESYEDLVGKIQTRRYTYSRVRRVLLNCLFGITKRIATRAHRESLYARVLAADKKSGILKLISLSSKIPVIIKSKDFISSELLKFDLLASEIYSVLAPKVKEAALDYTQKPFII